METEVENQMEFLNSAIIEARFNLDKNIREGGPFGAAIVKNGELIVTAHNEVGKTKEPTMHAEIAAIRKAVHKLGTRSLKGCEMYINCYPCPMCLGAIYWADIRKVYYGCTADYAAVKFDDRKLYKLISNESERHRQTALETDDIIEMIYMENFECNSIIDEWNGTSH